MSLVRRHALAVVLLLVLVAVALAPLPLWGEALGHPYGDLADHYWGTWWFGRSLLGGHLPLSTDLSHYPEALSLWYVDPVGASIALVFRPLGTVFSWNALVYVQVGAAALAGYALGHDLTSRRASGVVAGVVLAASPYVLGLVHSGLSEYLGLAPVALFTWALVRAMGLDPRGRPAPRRGWLVAGLLLALCAIQAWYYGVFGALLATTLVVGRGWRERLDVLWRVGAVAAVASLPLAAALVYTFLGEGAVSTANAPGWTGRLPATDLLTWVHPGEYYFPDTPSLGNPGILHVNYLGWAALALAGLGVARARSLQLRLGALAPSLVVFAVLCLGPRLAVGQDVAEVGGVSLVLPLGLLSFPGSPLTMVHQPYRMVAFLLPFLAGGAAMGVAALPAWARWVAPGLILAETLWLSPAPWPLATRSVQAPAIYATLEPGPILDWPPDASTWNRDYLIWQTTHAQPVPYGVNVALGERLRAVPLVARLLHSLDDRDRMDNRDRDFREPLFVAPSDQPEGLDELGFAWVVVHKRALTEVEWSRTRNLLDHELGDPAVEDEEAAAWRVGEGRP